MEQKEDKMGTKKTVLGRAKKFMRWQHESAPRIYLFTSLGWVGHQEAHGPQPPSGSQGTKKFHNLRVLGYTLGLGFSVHLLNKCYIIKQVPGSKTMSTYKKLPYFRAG